ncbi:MAG: HEAT repeat domain-containing protein, partial [Planctomycetota bacterium]
MRVSSGHLLLLSLLLGSVLALPARGQETDEAQVRELLQRIVTAERAIEMARKSGRKANFSRFTILEKRLAELGRKAVLPAVKISAETDCPYRMKALELLGNSYDCRAVPALIDALDDPNLRIRSSAAFGLRNQSDPSAVSAFIERLGKETDPEILDTICAFLGEKESEEAV